MGSANLLIIGMDEEKSQVNGIDQTFSNVIEENYSKLRKDTSI